MRPADFEETQFIFRRDLIRHLRLHQLWGHDVPERVFRLLEWEIQPLGNEVREECGVSGDAVLEWVFCRSVLEVEGGSIVANPCDLE